jgi:uncharacterized protein
MGDKKTVKRLDTIDFARWMSVPFTRTTDGFLTGRAIVTSIGVFTYRNKDGSVSRELRLPEEVFDRDSLDTMKLKPVTLDHPDEKVTPGNVEELQVGSLGSDPTTTAQECDWSGRSTPREKLTDGLHVAIDMTINRADAIDQVLNGKRALSMGYECDLEMAEPGATWCGMSYDGIQRKIRYNHCAIVDVARAGDAAKIRMDSADAVLINQPIQEGNSMKKIRLDSGVEYEGDEGLINAYLDTKKRADAAESKLADSEKAGKTALSTMEAERDSHKDRADKLDAELKNLKDKALDPKRLDEAVKARVDLLDAAIRAGVEVKDGMSDNEVQKAIITTVYPEAKLDGRDEAYIKGRFDSAMEELRKDSDGEGRQVVSDGVPTSGGREDSMTAYQRMVEFNKKRSRGDAKEGQ